MCPCSSSRAAGSVGSSGLGHRPSGSQCAGTVELKDRLGQSSLSCKKQKPHSLLKPNGSFFAHKTEKSSGAGLQSQGQLSRLTTPRPGSFCHLASIGFTHGRLPYKEGIRPHQETGQHRELPAAQEGGHSAGSGGQVGCLSPPGVSALCGQGPGVADLLPGRVASAEESPETGRKSRRWKPTFSCARGGGRGRLRTEATRPGERGMAHSQSSPGPRQALQSRHHLAQHGSGGPDGSTEQPGTAGRFD